MNSSNTILDLFAGAGGLSEGFWQCGYNIINHIEMDSYACETLRTRTIYYSLKEKRALNFYYNYLKNKISKDDLVNKYKLEKEVNSVINSEINKESYPHLLKQINNNLKGRKLTGIIGGPPCQAYSHVGRARHRNKMIGDKRNYLYQYYIQFLNDLSPNFFIFENVPGIFSAGKGEYLKDMLRKMRKLGYNVPDPKVINAQHYNVPQNRRRVFIVGWKSPKNIDIDLLFKEPENLKFTVNDFLLDLPPLKSGEGKSLSKHTKDSSVLKKLSLRNNNDILLDHICRPNNSRDKKIYEIAVKKLKKGSRLNYNDLPEKLKTHSNRSSFLDRFKVVDNNARAAHTIVAHISKDGHYYIHPDLKQNRSLSVREAARLQTFPDSYKFEGSRTSQYKQIGNAVPPLLSLSLAKNITAQLSII